MPSAEIITIGTEILLGEIVDTNARHIARSLRDAGIDLYRTTTVGDNVQRIADAIREALARCEIIITTGGLGPTIDDPTRDAVALAFGVPTEYRPELWEQIIARFQRYNRTPTENNRRQAYVPQGALAIENPVGTAPAFTMEQGRHSLTALPGVPSEMTFLLAQKVLPYLRDRYQITSIIKARVLHTAGVGESVIDERITDLEELSNPTVGLAAHSGQVDVRITAKANSEAEVDALIRPVEEELRRRMGRWVYGADAETLEEMALQAVQARGWSLSVVEAGLGGELPRRLTAVPAPANAAFRGGEILAERPSPAALREQTERFRQSLGAEVGLGVAVIPGAEKQEIHLCLITPDNVQESSRPYGGPPDYAPRWAFHHSLDMVRQIGNQ